MNETENCECKPYCESHGRQFLSTHEGLEYCQECAADGWSGQLCTPCSDSCDPVNFDNNFDDLEFYCREHLKSKMKFVIECYTDQ